MSLEIRGKQRSVACYGQSSIACDLITAHGRGDMIPKRPRRRYLVAKS